MTDETNLPSDDIARLTAKAVETCADAAQRIREVGAAALKLGQSLQNQCEGLASDFEGSGAAMAGAVRSYAQDLHEQSAKVREIKTPNGKPSEPARLPAIAAVAAALESDK